MTNKYFKFIEDEVKALAAHDWEAVVNLMDDDIREELHAIGYDNNDEFLRDYCFLHLKKYGETFKV